MPYKKKFRQIISKTTIVFVALSTILGSLGIPFSALVPVAEAAVTETTPATTLFNVNQTIKASSVYTAFFGFGLTATAGEKLTAVTFILSQSNGTVSASDFDGVAVFLDNGGTDDVLDGTDTKVGEQVPAGINVNAPMTVTLSGAGTAIPALTGSYNFIVAVKTSATISQGDSFSFGVAAGNGTYSLNNGQVNATAVISGAALVTDLQAPVYAGGGPPDGQIGAPVEAMIDRVFNETLAASSVATSTVFLQTNAGNVQGGAPTGANLCTSVSLSTNHIFCNHSSLTTNTWYTATFTTGITDAAGNPMATNFTSQFQTGSFGGGTQYNPPPFVLGTMPSPGGNLPLNGKLAVNFSSNMKTGNVEGSVQNKANVSLHLLSNGVVTGPEIIVEPDTNYLVWNAGNRQLTVIPPNGSLTAGNWYRLAIHTDDDTNPGNDSCGGVDPSRLPCVMNVDNLAMQGPTYTIDFQAVAADTCSALETPAFNSCPRVAGSFPDSAATGVDRAADDFSISFNEALDPQSVTSSTVKLYCEDTNNTLADGCDGTGTTVDDNDPEVTGTAVVLDSDGRMIHLSPNQKLPANSKFLIQIKGDGPAVTAGVHDVVGNYRSDHTDIAIRSFTTGSNVNGQTTDDTEPTVLFANADNFGIFITLSEAMKFSATANTSQSSSDGVNDVNNLANWTIETSPDNTNWMSMPLTGKTVQYRSYNRTLEITGMAMPPNQQFRATGSTNIQDLSGNSLSNTNKTAQGTVKSTFDTGGMLGPGQMTGPVNYANMAVSPISVFPKSPMAGVTSRYRAEFPANTAIPASGKITLTFPTGFSFTDDCATLPTDTFENNDINGPATGTVTIASIACSSVSRTVTITLGATGCQAGDMLRFEFQGVTNSTVPKDFSSSGYTVDIKTYNASSVLLESMTSMPFFISTPGSRTISGYVFVDTNTNGVKDGGEAGVGSIKVCLGGPSIGFQCTTTDINGAYSFTNLNNGFYHLELPPITSGAYTGGMMSRDVNVSGSNVAEDFGLQQASANFILTVAVTGTGLAGTKLDVFGFSTMGDISMGPASGPGVGSSVVRECTIGTDCNALQLPLSSGRWQIGVGPWMPKEPGVTSMPDFSFMPPQPVEVAVSASGIPDTYSCGGVTKKVCFALTAASNQIAGKVVDGSGNAIPNVFVMARPAFMTTGVPGGAGAGQTDINGLFNVKTVTGTYIVEASMPGMMSSGGMECTVKENTAAVDNNATADVYCGGVLIVNDVSGFNSTPITLSNVTSNDLVIKIAKGNTSISGQVLDDSSNPIPYAHVEAMEVDDSGNPQGGWRDSPTDNSGNYTLYVNGGSGTPKKWKVRGFAPGFGELPAITVAISEGETLSGKNLQATSADFGTVTGTVFVDNGAGGGTAGNGVQDGSEAGVQGAFVGIHGQNGGNGTVTDANGAYTLKVRAGSGYTIDGFVPSQGPTSVRTNVTVTANATLSNQNLTMAQPGTIVAYICRLNAALTGPTDATKSCSDRMVSGAFVDARDSNGRGNGTGSNPTSGQYELYVPAGTYTVRANEPAVGYIGSATAVVTGGGTTYVNIEPPALYQVSGTVTSLTSACIEGATAFLTSAATGRVILARVNSSGAWSVSNIPNGSYNVGVGKPGCVDSASPGTINVSGANLTQAGDADLARTLVAADATISGRVMISSTNVTFDTMIFANLANGTKVVGMVDTSQTGTSTNYTLNVTAGTWSVQARSDGYESTATSVTVASGGAGTMNINLTAIAGYTRKEPMPYSMKPSRGGIVKNPEIHDNFEINIPAGVLGTSTNDGSVLTKETTAVSNTSNQVVIGGKGIEVTPKDASGQPITTISSTSGSSATITIPYTAADVLAAGTTEDKLVIGAWSDEKGQWDPLPTTCDTVNDKCTATITHFSTFALNSPTSGNAPATPSGLTATAASSSQINLAWTAVSGASSYDVYRSLTSGGTFSRLGSEPTTTSTSYQNTGLAASTTYYYKVSALNDYGESAASSETHATTQAESGGGGVTMPPQVSPTPSPTPTVTPTPTATPSPSPTPSPLVKPISQMTVAELKAKIAEITVLIAKLTEELLKLQQVPEIPAGFKFKVMLKYGQKSEGVRMLQIFLKTQGTDIYPEGLVTGKFGELTRKAVIRFQEKYKDEILAPFGLTAGTGIVGTKTMLKINALMGR